MPGPVSEAWAGPPICRCEHFKEVHNWPGGDCGAEGCDCRQFREVALADTALGRAMDKYISGREGR